MIYMYCLDGYNISEIKLFVNKCDNHFQNKYLKIF